MLKPTHTNILWAFQDVLIVVDVALVHSAALTYVNAAARAEGSAAAVRDYQEENMHNVKTLIRRAMHLSNCPHRLSVGLAKQPWRS